MTKLSNILKKKPVLGPFCVHFLNFWGKKKFPGKSGSLSHTTSYGFLAPCQDLEKVNNTIQRKCSDRRKDRWKDGRIEGQIEGQTAPIL